MLNHFENSLKPILRSVKLSTLYYYLRANFYINRVAVTVEQDLASLPPLKDSLEHAGVNLVAITPGSLTQNPKPQHSLIYLDKKRQEKAREYLKKGYRGVAVVHDDEVCGDVWYVSARNHKNGVIHPDLQWLKMECGNEDVYAFDMNLHPSKRGKNLANMLQNGALHEIKENGYNRALGYYWADNIAALWVHRTLKWKELRRLKITRFRDLYFSHES